MKCIEPTTAAPRTQAPSTVAPATVAPSTAAPITETPAPETPTQVPTVAPATESTSNGDLELGVFTTTDPVTGTVTEVTRTMEQVGNDQVITTTTKTTTVTPERRKLYQVSEKADENMKVFYQLVMDECSATGWTHSKCQIQAKDIECLCLSRTVEVEDFSQEFRKNFRIPQDRHSQCVETVNAYENAKLSQTMKDMISITESKWQFLCSVHFGQTKTTDPKITQPIDVEAEALEPAPTVDEEQTTAPKKRSGCLRVH